MKKLLLLILLIPINVFGLTEAVVNIDSLSIKEIQEYVDKGYLTYEQITRMYLDRINEIVSKMYNEIKNYELFDLIKEKYENYISKQKVTVLKDFLKKGYYQSILSAYKIFYVGCSRARKNLIILVSKSKTNDYQLELIEKFKKIGFDVELQ